MFRCLDVKVRGTVDRRTVGYYILWPHSPLEHYSPHPPDALLDETETLLLQRNVNSSTQDGDS